MTFRANNRTNSHSSGSISLMGVVKSMAFLAVVGAALWMLAYETVQQRLSDHLESKVNGYLAGTGVVVSIGHGKFIENQGIRLGDVRLQLQGASGKLASSGTASAESRLEIYEAFIHLDATLADLATKQLKPSSVELKRAKLILVRKASGDWDFEPVVNQLMALKMSQDGPIPVLLTDCELQIVDLRRTEQSMTLTDIQGSVQPVKFENRPLLQIDGGFQTRAISQVKVTTYLDLTQSTWHCRLSADRARLSRELINLLPPELANQFDGLKTLSGTLDFQAQAEGTMGFDEAPQFECIGKLTQFDLDDDRLPVAVAGVNANFRIDDQGVSVSNATGDLDGQGRFYANYRQQGLIQIATWHCDGWVQRFHFDERARLQQWLPEYCQRFCEEYSPRGVSDVAFEFTHDGTKLMRRLTGDLVDMSFSFFRMPYRVDHCIGKVNWVDERCDFDVRSQVGDQPVKLNGFVDKIGHGATYQVTIAVPGQLPIDQKMFDALAAQPKLAGIVSAFNPTGYAGGRGVIEKRDPYGEATRAFDIRLYGCSIRHTGFNYPIYNVEGLVQVRDDEYIFSDLKGNNSSGRVSCNGTWDPDAGLILRFLCQSVPLNDQLRFALKREIREIWNGFRPRGKLDHLKVELTLPIEESEPDLIVEAIMREPQGDPEANYVSIYPVWFPYQINHLTGTIRIGKGDVLLTNIHGQHQKTWISCHGEGKYSDQSWSVRLRDLLVSSLKVDEDLLAAVPRSLAPPLAQLRFDGLANVSGEITLAGSNSSELPIPGVPQPAPSSLAWDVRIDMSQAHMLVGLPLRNVFGAVHLTGIYDGQWVHSDGQLNLDSMTVYGTQVTNIKGPIRIENDRVLAGIPANGTRVESAVELDPNGHVVPAESISGVLLGGVVRLDAELDSAKGNQFHVNATLTDSCLETTCREFAPKMENVEGRSSAWIELSGDGSGTT